MIEKYQIAQNFEGLLTKKKVNFEFRPEDIAFERNLHTWSMGFRVSIRMNPYPGELENLQKINAITREQLKAVWARWQSENNVGFVERVKEETLGLWKGLIDSAQQFARRKAIAMAKMAAGEDYNLELDDFFPPMSNDILEALVRIARKNGISEAKILETIIKYFNDVDSLLEIPQIKISSVMFAGWAYRATLGKKNPPKSTTDVQFISSYLPYCDALFVDKESALILKEFPKNVPSYLRLKEFHVKVFSLNNKEEFLSYLDQLVAEIPFAQIDILKDMEGENYDKPYWSIIEDEKRKLNNQTL
jgi:hypothetical protein